MDIRAESSLKWLVHWADCINNEVKALAQDLEGDRDQLEELRSAAAGLRMQAEALFGKLTLKPDTDIVETTPAPEPVPTTASDSGIIESVKQEATKEGAPEAALDDGAVAPAGESSTPEPPSPTLPDPGKPEKKTLKRGSKREGTKDSSR